MVAGRLLARLGDGTSSSTSMKPEEKITGSWSATEIREAKMFGPLKVGTVGKDTLILIYSQ